LPLFDSSASGAKLLPQPAKFSRLFVCGLKNNKKRFSGDKM